jgi:hypothetical protein
MVGINRLSEKIYEVIPSDAWISSKEIAEKTGIKYRRVGLIIHHYLSNKVDKNPTKKEGCFLYRKKDCFFLSN